MLTMEALKASIDKIGYPVWIVAVPSAEILAVNTASEELFGYTKEEFLALHISDIDILDDPEVVRKRSERVARYGSETFETKHKTKDGRILDTIITVKLDTINNTPILVAVTHNATPIRGQEEQFKAIFESIHDGVLILDIKLNRFSYANHAVLNMMDYSNVEIKNLSLQDLSSDFELNELTYQLAIVGEQSHVTAYPMCRKDGTTFLADIDLSMPYTIEGRDYIAVIIKDVTQEKAQEELLNRTTRIYESFFDQLPEAAWLVNPKTKAIVHVNEASIKQYGYAKEEFLALHVNDINVGDSQEHINEKMQKLQTQGSISFETKHRHKDGHILDVKVSAKLVTIGNERLLSVIASDITQQRAQEKIYLLNMRQAHMGEMISMIAHQWRQPLTVIGSINMQLLFDADMNTVDAQNIAEKAKKIEEQISYLSQTITDFRNFFKHDRTRHLVSIEDLIEKAMSILRSSLHSASITVHVDVDSIQVHTLVNEIVQVLIAMLKNSLDAFEEQSTVKRDIYIASYMEDNHVIMTIEDTAGGIKGVTLDDIFLPYISTKNQLNGTGLGLYMAKTIVEDQCQGKLSVQNTHQGAQFTISLPV